MSANPVSDVIWIRLEKPTFDVIGVVLSSFGIAFVCMAVALVLGACWGLVRIRRARARQPFEPELQLSLRAQAR